jgi:hypothetical protein
MEQLLNTPLRNEIIKELERIHRLYTSLDGKWIYATAQNYYNHLYDTLGLTNYFPVEIIIKDGKDV